MNAQEYKKLYAACKELDDGPDHRVDDYALNMIITAIDFQANSEVVQKAIEFFSENIGVSTYDKLSKILGQFANDEASNRRLSLRLWNNNMWTRAQFLRVLLGEFKSRKVTDQGSLKKWLLEADFEKHIKGQFRSEHHSIGIALFHWLCLRCGIDTIKPDLHIINFVSECIGRKASSIECVQELTKISKAQKRYAYLLDSAIWHLQKEKA